MQCCRNERVNRVYRRGEFEVLAVNEVTLTIPQGKFVAIMGPSGSGKTSILNLIAGIDHASSGTVTVAGNDLGVLSDRELAGWRAHNVGLIFQFYNLIPVLSARENVELPLMLTDLPKSERRTHVEAALRVAGLADRWITIRINFPAARNSAWRSRAPWSLTEQS